MFDVLGKSRESAVITHDHLEGIKGAQAIALAISLAKNGSSKNFIKESLSVMFHYDLEFKLDEIRPAYNFDCSCQGSVPQAIVAFLESTNYENAIRLAISLGGDYDTIACMTGGIAAAYYKEIPDEIISFVIGKLPPEFIEIIKEFDSICKE